MFTSCFNVLRLAGQPDRAVILDLDQLLKKCRTQQHVSVQAPSDAWEATDVQNREGTRRRIEDKEARRLQQEAGSRLSLLPEENGNQSLALFAVWLQSLSDLFHTVAMHNKHSLFRQASTGHSSPLAVVFV